MEIKIHLLLTFISETSDFDIKDFDGHTSQLYGCSNMKITVHIFVFKVGLSLSQCRFFYFVGITEMSDC